MPKAKDFIWKAAFARWPARPSETGVGYTLLLPVPADLPVFLRFALANAAAQDSTGRVETLVIPDMPSDAFRREFEAAVREIPVEGARLVTPGLRARLMQRAARNQPSANHFIQLHAGIAAARGRHVLFHDSDLFIEDPGFMAEHHRRAQGLGCLGVSPVWDDWLREQGHGHVVATWELMVDEAWVRSFAPWEHRPREEWLDGQRHVFDTMLWTQARTPPERCGLHEGATRGFEHFNWVIGWYRMFQNAGGAPFEDDRFLILLIRLLSDAFGADAGDAPPAAELSRGLTDADARVTYRDPKTHANYAEFRRKVERILAAPVVGDRAGRVREGLAPFDAALS